MKQILARFAVNIFACLFLSFLLLGPTAFSATLVTFEKDETLTVREEDFRFGQFLKIESQTKEVSRSWYSVTFTLFPQKQALYKDILKLANNSNTSQTVKISDLQTLEANIFFAQGDNPLEGPQIVTLDPDGIASVNLLAMPAKGQVNEVDTLSFSLEVE
jgi:hypothetical protein